jgi:hypothetical protein
LDFNFNPIDKHRGLCRNAEDNPDAGADDLARTDTDEIERELFLGLKEFRRSEQLFHSLNKVIDEFYPWHPWAKLTLVNRRVIFFIKAQ